MQLLILISQEGDIVKEIEFVPNFTYIFNAFEFS